MSKTKPYELYGYTRKPVYNPEYYDMIAGLLGIDRQELGSLIFDGKITPVINLNPDEGYYLNGRTYTAVQATTDGVAEVVIFDISNGIGTLHSLGHCNYIAGGAAQNNPIDVYLEVDDDVIINHQQIFDCYRNTPAWIYYELLNMNIEFYRSLYCTMSGTATISTAGRYLGSVSYV